MTGNYSEQQLIEATYDIRKKLGYDNTKMAIDLITQGDLKAAVEIILRYYDKRYFESLSRKSHQVENRFEIKMKDLPRLAKVLSNKTQNAV